MFSPQHALDGKQVNRSNCEERVMDNSCIYSWYVSRRPALPLIKPCYFWIVSVVQLGGWVWNALVYSGIQPHLDVMQE